MIKFNNIELFEGITLSWEEELLKERLRCFSFWEEENKICTECPLNASCRASLLQKLYDYTLRGNISIEDNIEGEIVKGEFLIEKAQSVFYSYAGDFVCGFCDEVIKNKAVWFPKYGLVHEFCYKSDNLIKGKNL